MPRDTNRNLLVFAIFLVLVGAGTTFYFLSALGAILLIASLIPGPRGSSPPRPSQTQTPPPRRIMPSIPKPVERSAPSTPVQSPPVSYQPTIQALNSTTSLSYSPALFPTSMFPNLTLQASMPAAVAEKPTQKQPVEKDEILEVGTILALLKLALG